MSRLSTLPRRVLASLVAIALFVTLAPLSVGAGHPPLQARPDGIGAPTEMARMTHLTPAAGDLFGLSVAVSGQWAVVGTPERDYSGQNRAGMASAYRWSPVNGWRFSGDLPVNDPGGDQYVGWSVAASPSQLFVGAFNKSGGTDKMIGLVYVYDTTGVPITIEQTLSVDVPGGAAGDFGAAIAVDGDTLVVGATNASVGATMAGAVFVFENGPAGWVQTQRINAPYPELWQSFGGSVAIQGNDLIVGSPQWGDDYAGRVDTFHRNALGDWMYVGDQHLESPSWNDSFGWSVAVSDGLMVASAPGRDTSAGIDAGVAYVSRWNGIGWQAIADQESLSATDSEMFGWGVALSPDTMLVSSRYGIGTGGAKTGAVYQFTVDPFPLLPPTFKQRIYAAEPGTGPIQDEFGRGLAFDGDTMLAGGISFSTPVMQEGAAWFFGGLRTARCRVDRTLSVPMPGLLGNDGAPESTMTASLVSSPAHGIATVNADGSWSYDPTSWFLGTDTFQCLVSSDAATSAAAVTVEVYPPPARVHTSITIKRSASSVRRRRTVKLYGRLSPGALGDPCVVYVKKPGSRSWRKLSTRHASSITPNVGANWSYSLKPTRRGKYYFKVRFPGDAHRYSDWSSALSVRVR